MCPEHEMEKVNMYCEVCKRPVCHLCKLGGSHANHKVTSMSSAYKILKVPNLDTCYCFREDGVASCVCMPPALWRCQLSTLEFALLLSAATNEYLEPYTILTCDNKD